MQVTHVPIVPSDICRTPEHDRKGLTPQLLATCGARYSRSPEGLDVLLKNAYEAWVAKGEEGAVNSIFKMVDYGHQSILDLAPLAMFMDNLSIWLIYHVFALTPTAGGQETSTRYVRFTDDGVLDKAMLPAFNEQDMGESFDAHIAECFAFYGEAEKFWTKLSLERPELIKIPQTLLAQADDGTELERDKACKTIDRMRRNYVFDRARYFLPVAATNNMMLVMSARGWMQLCQSLLSDTMPEAVLLGEAIVAELAVAAPQMTRHAVRKDEVAANIAREFHCLTRMAGHGWSRKEKQRLPGGCVTPYQAVNAYIEQEDRRNDRTLFVNALEGRTNRYSPIGRSLRNTAVRFTIDAISFAETRDLNRHRTGSKDSLLYPVGFYCALDQVPVNYDASILYEMSLAMTRRVGDASRNLVKGYRGYVYFLPLGFQHYFGHLTTGDKFVYETELRTGLGAHFRYAAHMRVWLQHFYRQFPQTRGLILEGLAETE